jgi:hypothetical protein
MKKSTHSNSKAQWWRTGLIMGLIFTIGIINFGCEKCEECDPDEYYVKYETGSFWIRSPSRDEKCFRYAHTQLTQEPLVKTE